MTILRKGDRTGEEVCGLGAWGADQRVLEPELTPPGLGSPPLARQDRARGLLLAWGQEGEDLGLPKCLLHQEINSLRTGFSDEV